jgi:hypothetical protein
VEVVSVLQVCAAGPVRARRSILETSGGSQPGIDELEIYGPAGQENLALAERGSVASASSVLPGYADSPGQAPERRPLRERPQLDRRLARRRVGADRIARAAEVARVIITRDRTGKYRDRIPEVFEVLVSQDGQQWQSVAKRDRTPPSGLRRLPYCRVDRLPEKSWDGFLQYTFLRERATWSKHPGGRSPFAAADRSAGRARRRTVLGPSGAARRRWNGCWSCWRI